MYYDALQTSLELEAAGADRKLAEAIAKAIGKTATIPDISHLVTKDDFKTEMASLKSGLELTIADRLNTMCLTMGSGFVATIGILGTLIAFLHH